MKSVALLTLALSGGLASIAAAATINISDIGGGVVLNSGPLSSVVFTAREPAWTQTSLALIHTSLNTSGIATNGKISFIAADTDNGLSLIVLIDQMLVEGAPSTAKVHMDSIGQGANLAFILDTQGDVAVSAPNTNSRIASGDFGWNSNGGGNGFAWAGLAVGNTSTYRFNKVNGAALGLDDPSTFQFINWTGTNWAIVPLTSDLTSFTSSGDFGFVATVVPAPSAVALLGGPALGLSMIRRRRTR